MKGDSPPSAGRPTGQEFAWLAGLTLLAALLRFPFLSRFGLWLDEIYVRKNALEPLAENLKTVHFVHFIAVKAGLAVVDNPFGLRLASACFGVAAVPLAFFAVRRALGSATALLFACFLAVTPYFINYSIDANYYSHVIFWSLAGLATAFRCYQHPRPWLLLPLGVFGLLAFFVHPFSAAFFVTAALVMTLSIAGGWNHREEGAPKTEAGPSQAKYAGYGIAGVLLVILLWALSGTAAGRELIRVAGRFMEMIEPGESPTNIEFTIGFFENYFRRIGPAYYAISEELGGGLPLMPAATLGIFGLFCGGLVVLRRQPEHVATVLLPFLLSFGVIFNLKAERHFNLRYFSTLVPLYWLSISAAIAWVVERLLDEAPAPEDVFRRRVIRGLPFAAIAILFLPQYVHLILTDGRNWDEVMPVIAERIEPGEPIVYTNWAEETMLPHYQGLYGLEDVKLQKLPHTRRRSALTAAELRDLCYRTPALWFVSSWLAIHSPEAVAWAESRMEAAARGRSIFSDHYNVTAFHWSWGGRYILAPRILDYAPRASDFQSGGFSQRFLVEKTLSYRIEVIPKPGGQHAQPALEIDGKLVTLRPSRGDARPALWSGESELGSGEHHISVAGLAAEGFGKIRFAPLYPDGGVRIEATEPSDFYPSDYVWSPERDGEAWLCLKRNTFASYEFGISDAGIYELTTEAVHDRPSPVWIELRLSGDVLGVIQFEAGNDRVGTRRFPLRLTEGNHTLTARFLNEGNVETGDDAVDRDAWIRGFELKRIDDPGADERVLVPRDGWAQIGLGRPGSRELDASWSTVTDGDLNPELVVAEIPGRVAWKATLPRESKGLLLKSPILAVPRAPLVYVSGLVRTENLLNHSANMKVYFFDENGERIGERVVNQEGIYETTGWVRFVEFQPVPESVAFFQAAFWVYPNGRQPSQQAGDVYFGDFRVETGRPEAWRESDESIGNGR